MDGTWDCHTGWSESEWEKKKYCILMHICEIQKIGIENPIYKAEVETQT